MTDITALAVQAQEIVISDNAQFIYWAEFLKTLTRSISEGEKLKEAVKGKLKGYRDGLELDRKRREGEVLRLARVRAGSGGIPEPAATTNMLPEVEGLHYRTKTKWRVKNLKIVPREYLVPDEKNINAIVKALGQAAGIRGIEVYEDQTPVGRG